MIMLTDVLTCHNYSFFSRGTSTGMMYSVARVSHFYLIFARHSRYLVSVAECLIAVWMPSYMLNALLWWPWLFGTYDSARWGGLIVNSSWFMKHLLNEEDYQGILCITQQNRLFPHSPWNQSINYIITYNSQLMLVQHQAQHSRIFSTHHKEGNNSYNNWNAHT